MSDNIQQQDGLTVVMMRNSFYRDSYKLVLFAVVALLIINCILGFTIGYKISHPPQPQYFATTPDGRIINIHPLSDPVVTDDFVLQWSTQAAQAAFDLDYVHWRQQLQRVSSNFTPYGWKWFLNQFKATNNLKTLVSEKMVSNAEVTGAPQLVEKTVVDGHFAWKIQVPMLVTYQNATKTIPQTVMLTMIVIRMPVQDDPHRIAINNFIADVR